MPGYSIDSGVNARVVRDSAGRRWALYVLGTSLYLRTSADGGRTWSAAELVVTEAYSGTSGIEFDVAIDSSDVIHVVYRVRVNGSTVCTLYHMHRDPVTGWSVKEDILGVTGYYKYPKIAIDSGDSIHCVYHRGTGGPACVRYVRRTVGVWGGDIALATKWSIGIDSSYRAQDICVDSLNNLHVVYTGWATVPDLHYRLYDGAWQAEETIAGFADANLEQRYPSVAVDSSNVVHVAWFGEGYADEVCHIAGNTGAWGAVEAIANGSYPNGIAIAINGLDEIDICFAGSGYSVTNLAWTTGNHIKYSGGAWGAVVVISDYNVTRIDSMLWSTHPGNDILARDFGAVYSASGLKYYDPHEYNVGQAGLSGPMAVALLVG